MAWKIPDTILQNMTGNAIRTRTFPYIRTREYSSHILFFNVYFTAVLVECIISSVTERKLCVSKRE